MGPGNSGWQEGARSQPDLLGLYGSPTSICVEGEGDMVDMVEGGRSRK